MLGLLQLMHFELCQPESPDVFYLARLLLLHWRRHCTGFSDSVRPAVCPFVSRNFPSSNNNNNNNNNNNTNNNNSGHSIAPCLTDNSRKLPLRLLKLKRYAPHFLIRSKNKNKNNTKQHTHKKILRASRP